MIIVSGCPRSGTSLTMNLMEQILGEDRILGSKFPFEDRVKGLPGDEPVGDLGKRDAAANYAREALVDTEKVAERSKKSRSMNPNGFYECRYSVKGIRYNFPDRENLAKYLQETSQHTCVKIVSQGLLNSDPRYISKIVYLVRHPRAVAKSQENLLRVLETKGKIHSPEMYIDVTIAAARFFLTNPDIPAYFLNYDDLLSDPMTYIKEVCDFLGEDPTASWEKAKNIVDPTLRRSEPEEIDHDLWEDAESIYSLFNARDFEGIFTYLENPKRKIHQQHTQWTCARTGKVVESNTCKACMLKPDVRQNFKIAARNADINWRAHPCLFECGFDLSKDEEDLKTIAESVANNFWVDTEPSVYMVVPMISLPSFSRSYEFAHSVSEDMWRDVSNPGHTIQYVGGAWRLTLSEYGAAMFIYVKMDGTSPTGTYTLFRNNSGKPIPDTLEVL